MQKMSADNNQSILETTRCTKEAARTSQDVRNVHQGTSSILMTRGGISDENVADYEQLTTGVMNLVNTPFAKTTTKSYNNNKNQKEKRDETYNIRL